MKTISMSTQGIRRAERADAWREVVCESIHNVIVDQISPLNFEAVITAQRYNTVSCAHFQSKAHRVLGAAERYADAGASGYLLSWQVEGQAHVAQGNTTLLQEAGTVAIVDGRRAMEVSFPSDVCRVVANLPARVIERRLPQLVRMHAIAFAPQGPFAEILFLINELDAWACSHRPLQQLKLQAQDPQDTPTQAVSRARSSRSPQPSSTARHRLA